MSPGAPPGNHGIRRIGNRGYATLVVSGKNRFLLLGRTIVPEPTLSGTAFLPLTADAFRFWRATSAEHLQRLHERIAEIERIRQEFGSCAIPGNEDDDRRPLPARTSTTFESWFESWLKSAVGNRA